MGGSKHISKYDEAPEDLRVSRMAITPKIKPLAIRIRAINKNDEVLSECLMSPEEAYDYAKAILKVYDMLSDQMELE